MAQPTLLDSKTIYELERQKVQEKLAPHQNPAAVTQAQANVDETKQEAQQPAQQPGDKPQEKQPSKVGAWLKDKAGEFKQALGTNNGGGFGAGASATRDLTSIVKGQPQGNVMDANAAGAKATAQEIQNTATQQQMAAQRSQQVADRNPYAEAGKMASVQNDAQNRQNVQKSGVLGAGAALARSTNAPDVQSQQARQDSQQGMANEMNTAAGQSREEATSGFADANTFTMKSRDFNNDVDQTETLANGRGAGQTAQDKPGQENEIDYANDDKFKKWAESKGYKLVDSNGQTVGSDMRIKNIEGFAAHFDKCLSDFRMKRIREGFDNGEMCSEDDWNWLCSKAGNFKAGDREWGPDDEGYDNSVLDGYANFIKNYVYTYKPEATQIDQSIDPNEEHIGPMAQDIEQVNPACIKETPEGVKTVDTGRLAMMNAGAIADLAREVKEINEKFAQLGI